MGCRNELLVLINEIIAEKETNEFSLGEVVKRAKERNFLYSESNVRTHVCAKMCANAPEHHKDKTEDLKRISRGLYKLL